MHFVLPWISLPFGSAQLELRRLHSDRDRVSLARKFLVEKNCLFEIVDFCHGHIGLISLMFVDFGF